MTIKALFIAAITLLMVLSAHSLGAQLTRNPGVDTPPPPPTNKELFGSFLSGGYLMPIRISYQSSSAEDVTNLSSYSLSLLRFGLSNLKTRKPNMPVFHGYVGLVDNAAASYGTIQGEEKVSYYGDIFSLYAGAIMPFLDYKAYVSAGAKIGAFVQGPIHSEYEVGGTMYSYVYEFEGADGKRGVKDATPISAAWELSAQAGYRIYQNFFVSLGTGVRHNKAFDGNWYLKSDVDSWLDGTWTNSWEPDPWISDPVWLPLPSRNIFYEGFTPYISISIGTNF